MAFFIGDKVRVAKKVVDFTDDFRNSWVGSMDRYVGKEFIIGRIDPKLGIEFEEDDTFYFPPASLELVVEVKPEAVVVAKSQAVYQSGDKVQVVHNSEKHNPVFVKGKVYTAVIRGYRDSLIGHSMDAVDEDGMTACILEKGCAFLRGGNWTILGKVEEVVESKPKTRHEEMEEAFERFHAANPVIWEHYVKFAREAIANGVKILGISLLTERIRWEIKVVTQSEDGYKISNNHRAFYSRKLMKEFPEFAGLFTTREQKVG